VGALGNARQYVRRINHPGAHQLQSQAFLANPGTAVSFNTRGEHSPGKPATCIWRSSLWMEHMPRFGNRHAWSCNWFYYLNRVLPNPARSLTDDKIEGIARVLIKVVGLQRRLEI